MTNFLQIDLNLRACFAALAMSRANTEMRMTGGVAIISLGVQFGMFNAAFLTEPVTDERDLDRRISIAAVHFHARELAWAFWLCDGYLSPSLQKAAKRCYSRRGMRLASQMPGMWAKSMDAPVRDLPACELREAVRGPELETFRKVGAECFRVPAEWFGEVFDGAMTQREGFRPWIAYAAGRAVTTVGTVVAEGAIGIYNVATLPAYRARGYAESAMREAVARERERAGDLPLVLQSTRSGLHLYERLGFQAATEFRVWVD